MRKNFFEILSSSGFDTFEEYRKLQYLFAGEESIFRNHRFETLKDYADDTYFRGLPFRGTYTTIDEIMAYLNSFSYSSVQERLFVFCEFLIAVLPEEHIQKNRHAYNQTKTIIQNIVTILEQTNHELHALSDSRIIIVEKNPHTTQAVELVGDEKIAMNLLEYNHFALKGDLDGKREILVNLGRYLEPLLVSRKLQKNGYKQIESDMSFLLNCFHIRHNNKEGSHAQEYIQKINDPDLENWYDKVYNTALAVIIINEQIDIDAELAALKSTYKWKT